MDPTLQKVLARLNRVSGQLKELRDGVRQALAIAALDPDMALTRARKVLEFVVRDVFQRRTGEDPGTRPLENLLQRLVKDGHFPKRLSAYANAVRELGNVGTHGYGEGVTKRDVARSLTQLTVILEWYFEKERPAEAREADAPVPIVPLPSAIPTALPARDAAPVRRPRRASEAKTVVPSQPPTPFRLPGAMIGIVTAVLVCAGAAGIFFLAGPVPSTSPPRKPAPLTDTSNPQPSGLHPPGLPSTWAPPSLLDCTVGGVSAADMKQAQAAWAKYLGRQVEEEDEIAPGVGMKYVLVPPGKFRMGSPDGEQERGKDETQHEVELTRPFYLGVNDVTQAEYDAVATGQDPSNFKGPNLPVETVSAMEADDFARKLTEKAKGGLLYRLPTEAEWEYSCRGGRSSSLPFGIGDGTSLSSLQANIDGNYPYGGAAKGPYLEKTSPVGTYEANALGLYDMQGNVYQWCADYYGDYPTEKVTNPTGPSSGPSRVCRGGCWDNFAWSCRAAFRGWNAPGDRHDYLGFRLARVPSGLDK